MHKDARLHLILVSQEPSYKRNQQATNVLGKGQHEVRGAIETHKNRVPRLARLKG